MRMKRGRLPLTALRSFEAGGCLLSFSHAAEELFVSQAAISRQIRELETFMGTPLFERLHQRVVLTEAGRSLLEKLTTSFDEIDLGACACHGRIDPGLCFRHPPSSLNRRLRTDGGFRASTGFGSNTPMSTSRSTWTCGSWNFALTRQILSIRFGSDRAIMAADARRSTSLTERTTPVLAPALLASGPPLHSPADLRHYTLLHDYDWDELGKLVPSGSSFPDFPSHKGPIYPAGAQAIQAAEALATASLSQALQ